MFRNVKEVDLYRMPSLSSCMLMNSFQSIETVSMVNAGAFEKDKQLSGVVERERIMREMLAWGRKKETVGTIKEWNRIDNRIGTIVVSDRGCKRDMPVVDCSRFSNLKEFRVGDDCFENTTCMKLTGLRKLERVVIGKRCCCWKTLKREKGMFIVKDCVSLKELKISSFSFMSFSVCRIENGRALQSIEMGDDCFCGDSSYSLSFADLELKSSQGRWWSFIDMPNLRSLVFGENAFYRCQRVVLESDELRFR